MASFFSVPRDLWQRRASSRPGFGRRLLLPVPEDTEADRRDDWGVAPSLAPARSFPDQAEARLGGQGHGCSPDEARHAGFCQRAGHAVARRRRSAPGTAIRTRRPGDREGSRRGSAGREGACRARSAQRGARERVRGGGGISRRALSRSRSVSGARSARRGVGSSGRGRACRSAVARAAARVGEWPRPRHDRRPWIALARARPFTASRAPGFARTG